MLQRSSAVAIAAVLVVTVSACTKDKRTATPVAPPSSIATSTAPPSSEEAALRAYRGMWDAYVEAAKTSDPDAPDLRRYTSDNALKLIVSALVTNREDKKIVLGELKVEPKVTAIQADGNSPTATVLDCVDDTKWLVHKSSGELFNDVPGGRHRTTATVKASNGEWKVGQFTLEDSGTC